MLGKHVTVDWRGRAVVDISCLRNVRVDTTLLLSKADQGGLAVVITLAAVRR